MSDDRHTSAGKLAVGTAMGFVVLFGVVSLFGDMTYEGGRSIVGQYLGLLGAGAVGVGIAAGAGELLGYAIRLASGVVADRTKRYWTVTIVGYSIGLLALPCLAFVGRWEVAILLVFAERIGKAIRKPSVDAMLGFATSQTGRGFGFGLHEAMDQIGAFLGPVFLSALLFVKGRGEASIRQAGEYQAGFALLFVPAALAIATVLAARFVFPRPADFEIPSKSPKVGTRGFSRAYWLYLVAAALLAAGMNDFAFIAFHFRNETLVPEFWIPAMYAIAMAVDAASALLFGRLYDKKGFGVLIALFAVEAFTAPFLFLGGRAAALVGLGLWGTSMGVQESVMRAAVADLVPADRRGTAYGMFHTAFGVAWFAGSALMGVLYDWNLVVLVAFSVAIQLAAIPVFVAASRARRRGLAQVEPPAA